jgi:hypothetical protein
MHEQDHQNEYGTSKSVGKAMTSEQEHDPADHACNEDH